MALSLGDCHTGELSIENLAGECLPELCRALEPFGKLTAAYYS